MRNCLVFGSGRSGTSMIGGFDGWAGQIDFAIFYNQWLADGQLQTVFENYSVPEPGSLMILALGGLCLALRRRRRR